MSTAEEWRGSPRSRALAWLLAVLASTGFVLMGVVDVRRDGWSVLGADSLGGIGMVVFFVGLGTLLSLRRPANPIGWLLTCGGMTWLTSQFAVDYALAHLADSSPPPALAVGAAYLDENIWLLGVLCSVGLPLLLFPEGRPLSARWRRVVVVMAASALVALMTSAVASSPFANPVDGTQQLTNPWGVRGVGPVVNPLRGVAVTVLMASMLLAVASVVLRFRRATGVERQQLRWVRAGAMLAVAGMFSVYVAGLLDLPSGVSDALVALGLGCLPLSLTIAVLRYRLYDLDRIVSRTVTYAAVTALLVGTYVGLVTAVSRLTPSSSSLAVAASTLAVAALFQPLRRRVQSAVDRRFNRARYDTEQTVDDFSRRLREQVSLDLVRADLLAVAQQTMQPVSAGLWLRAGS